MKKTYKKPSFAVADLYEPNEKIAADTISTNLESIDMGSEENEPW